jgi:hypothetical protein
LDPEDRERHTKNGIYVQPAFIDRKGKPGLTSAERELFISKCHNACWHLLARQPR